MINYVNIDLLQYRPKYSHFYCKMSKRDEGPGVGGGGGGGTPLQEADRDVPLDGVAFSRPEWL